MTPSIMWPPAQVNCPFDGFIPQGPSAPIVRAPVTEKSVVSGLPSPVSEIDACCVDVVVCGAVGGFEEPEQAAALNPVITIARMRQVRVINVPSGAAGMAPLASLDRVSPAID